MEITKAVVPAAGLGTRLLPATKSQPKEMLPVVDRPAIQWVVEEAIAAGISDLLIITGRGKRTLEDHFDRSIELERHLAAKNNIEALAAIREISNGPITFFVRQKQPLGLGHAVLCAEKHVGKENFAVMLGDDIFVSNPPAIKQMMDFYQHHPGMIIAVQKVPKEQIPLYGIVSVLEKSKPLEVSDIVEKPTISESPSDLAVIGRYILPPDIFQALKETKPDKNGEIQLTNAIKKLIGKLPVYAYQFSGCRYDIGNLLTYLQTNIELALKNAELSTDISNFITKLISKKDFKT
jgi:UTP--glucose-1-phosphate uridylyltransferase